MTTLALELAESYAPSVHDHGRTLLWSVEADLQIFGDRELIAQAVVNLLENAQRHTPRETVIRLILVAAEDCICLRVIDNGPGVASSDLGNIVRRFARLESSRTTAGHGLGLNLVSAVAKLHGGRLLLESDDGLSATLELPRDRRNSDRPVDQEKRKRLTEG